MIFRQRLYSISHIMTFVFFIVYVLVIRVICARCIAFCQAATKRK